MKREYFFRLIYLAPEYIIIYLLSEKFLGKANIAYFSLCIVYTWFITCMFQNNILKIVLKLLLLMLPFGIGCIPILYNEQGLGVALVLTVFSIFRAITLYLFPLNLPYSMRQYLTDTALLLMIVAFASRSALGFIAVFLRLLLVVGSSVLYEETISRDMKKMMLTFSAVLLLSPICIAVMYWIMEIVSHFSNVIDNFINADRQYSMTFTNMVLQIAHYLFIGYAAITKFFFRYKEITMFLWLILICIAMYYIFLAYEPKETYPRENNNKMGKLHGDMGEFQYVEKKESLKPLIKDENISMLRKAYRKLLLHEVKIGYMLHKNSTPREFLRYLKQKGGNESTLEEINALYEKERYNVEKEIHYLRFNELYRKLLNKKV